MRPLNLIPTGSEMPANRPRVPRFSAGDPSEPQIDQADVVTSIITILFGAIHCCAWSFEFPSDTERLLWRITSLIITVSPVFWAALFGTFLLNGDDENLFTSILTIFTLIAVPLYLLSRTVLLVIAFLGLRSLPPAAYQTVYWTTFIPHV